MTGHAIRDGRAVCLEPETALCRARWDHARCDCETLGLVEQNADGTWSHYVCVEDGDDEHRSISTVPPSGCNVSEWLNSESLADCGPDDAWTLGDGLLPDGTIDVEWDGDRYIWTYAEPRPVGALIGRLAVAHWVDDHDYDWEATA